MAAWSAENATKAYLRTLKMGKGNIGPDESEFISALAAGNNAQLMVLACGGACDFTLPALAAAAHQTGGRVICILQEQYSSKKIVDCDSNHVKFIVGEAETLLKNEYGDADFVLIDGDLSDHERIFEAAKLGRRGREAIVLGYNAYSKGSWRWGGADAHFLPIGRGLLVSRTTTATTRGGGDGGGRMRRSHWVVKVDECTGEEHVFRIKTSCWRPIEA